MQREVWLCFKEVRVCGSAAADSAADRTRGGCAGALEGHQAARALPRASRSCVLGHLREHEGDAIQAAAAGGAHLKRALLEAASCVCRATALQLISIAGGVLFVPETSSCRTLMQNH